VPVQARCPPRLSVWGIRAAVRAPASLASRQVQPMSELLPPCHLFFFFFFFPPPQFFFFFSPPPPRGGAPAFFFSPPGGPPPKKTPPPIRVPPEATPLADEFPG